MLSVDIASLILLICSSVIALPAISEITKDVGHARIQPRCGPVSSFYGQTPQDWVSNNLDTWLNTWITTNQANITANEYGFAGAFGQWAQGDPDWSCRDDGSSSDCDFDPCDNRVLNDKGDQVREAYYVLEAVNKLHSYFTGLSQAFEVSSIFAALSKDEWAETFYKDKDDKSVTVLKEILNAVATVIGIGAAFAGLGGTAIAAAAGAAAEGAAAAGAGASAGAGAASSLFGGGVSAAGAVIGQQ